MFVGFPNHFTAESELQRAAGQAENAENFPYFLCEFSDLCGEGNVTPPFYPLPSFISTLTSNNTPGKAHPARRSGQKSRQRPGGIR
jgi:hypothetical protein